MDANEKSETTSEQNPKNSTQKRKLRVAWTDVAVPVGVGIGLVFAFLFPKYIAYTGLCIAIIICLNDKAKITIRSGLNRIILATLGGTIALLVNLFDHFVQNQWAFIPVFMVGLFVTLVIGKLLVPTPPIMQRIGGVIFSLSCLITRVYPYNVSILSRYEYIGTYLLGTILGVAIGTCISWLFAFVIGKIKAHKSEKPVKECAEQPAEITLDDKREESEIKEENQIEKSEEVVNLKVEV